MNNATQYRYTRVELIIHCLVAVAVFVGLLWLVHLEQFSFRWFWQIETLTVVAVFILPLALFQFAFARFLLDREPRLLRIILSIVLGIFSWTPYLFLINLSLDSGELVRHWMSAGISN
jgi:hypothetical protein